MPRNPLLPVVLCQRRRAGPSTILLARCRHRDSPADSIQHPDSIPPAECGRHGLSRWAFTLCRREHRKKFQKVFRTSVAACEEAGMVSLAKLAVDGTRVEANNAGSQTKTAADL